MPTPTRRAAAGALLVLALGLSACEIKLASPPPEAPNAAPSVPSSRPTTPATVRPNTPATRPTTVPTTKAPPSAPPTSAPTVAPTPTPTPKPTTAPTTPAPKPGGAPGVPPGTRLTVMKGDLTITKAGTVISNADILGRVSIKAPNVTIRNSRIRAQAPTSSGVVSTKAKNVVIQDSEIRSDVRNPNSNGVMGWGFTLERVDIHSVVDQVHIHGEGNVAIRDSWLHGNTHYEQDPNWGGKPSHDDNIQITSGSNILVEGSTLQDSHSAAVMLGQDHGNIRNVVLRDNVISGGACSVNVAPKDLGPLTGLAIAGNEFVLGTTRLTKCAVIASPTYRSALASNVWQQTGDEVTLTRG